MSETRMFFFIETAMILGKFANKKEWLFQNNTNCKLTL